MPKFKVIGALLGALLSLLAVVVTASVVPAALGAGETVWLCAERTVAANECLVASENLTIVALEDRGLPAAVDCEPEAILDEGWVGPGAEDEVTKVTFVVANKKEAKACWAPPTAKLDETTEDANACPTAMLTAVAAINLPWLTLVELINEVTYDRIAPGPSGRQPGFQFVCAGVTDTCNSQVNREPRVKLTNLSLEGTEFPLVDALFLKEGELLLGREFLDCSLGGVEKGTVTGELLLAGSINGVAVTLETSEP